MPNRNRIALICAATLTLAGLWSPHAAEADKVAVARARLLQTVVAAEYGLTPEVETVFLEFARAEAMADLAGRGKALPAEFLAWVDSDRETVASVYGVHDVPADVLLILYSLQLDLGEDRLRKYRQLALATAIVNARMGFKPDLTPREPLELAIGGDPRKSVDTADLKRELDKYDHIINFLNGNTIEEDVVVGHKEETPELKYDERGVAIPTPKRGGKPKKVPIMEKRTRALRAADVLASRELQEKFNAYMASKGHPTDIDCGDGMVHWKSRDMIRGPMRAEINEAFVLFRTAYEEKGLLPKARDPFPTPAERCAYLIRNNEYTFPAEIQKERKWPRFPLTAPWPVLMMLVNDAQPLREREERWVAFRDQGVFKTYGEYIGSVAQQFDMQSARRIQPHPFTYGTIQMMLKDGGVCGTMGNISARSHNTLGVPASTAGQPGHCAVVMFRFDPKTKTYACKGAQYATGGDDKTTPHTPWFLGQQVEQRNRNTKKMEKTYPRKPMVYQQSLAWAVNHGLAGYLSSAMALRVCDLLPEEDRRGHGIELLKSGLSACPYNIVLVDAAQRLAATPLQQIDFWKTFEKTLASSEEKPGCPKTGLYPATIKNHVFARLAKLPVPTDTQTVKAVLAFLRESGCTNADALIAYRHAESGLDELLKQIGDEYIAHLQTLVKRQGRQNDTDCAQMAAILKAVAGKIKSNKDRKAWANALCEHTKGREKYVGHKYRVQTDPSVQYLAKTAGRKLPEEAVMVQPILDRVAADLGTAVAGDRDIRRCRDLSSRITNTATAVQDPEQKRKFLGGLAALIEGKESFKPGGAKKNAKPVRDPCADVIKKLQDALAQ